MKNPSEFDSKRFKLDIGKKLKKARIESGLSQSELGKMLDLTHGAIGSYERGRLRISTSLLLKLCEILNRPLTYFLSEDKELENKYKEELEQKKSQYDLQDNLEFTMEMSIRTFLKSRGIDTKDLNTKVNEVLDYINENIITNNQ